MNHSNLRKEELAIWQDTFDEPVLTLKRPCATRWLSLNDSVATLGRSYTSILAFLQMQAISSSQAAQLLSTLQTWRYAATTYFLWDIVGDLAQLSKVFQKSTLLIHQQLQFVASTKRSIRVTYLSDKGPGSYRSHASPPGWCAVGPAQRRGSHLPATAVLSAPPRPVSFARLSACMFFALPPRPQFGTHFKKWSTSIGEDLIMNGQQLQQAHEDVSLFQQDVRAFAEAVITSFEERFPDDQLMESASVIDPSLIPSSDVDLVTYGNDELTYLAVFLEDVVHQETLEEEWMRFKFIKFPSTSLHLAAQSLWDFYFQYRNTFTELWKLVQIILVLPLNTAACERGCSLMNIVKTDRRNRLSDELLDHLMVVSPCKIHQK